MKKFKRKLYGENTKVTLFVDKSRRDEFKYESIRSEYRGDNIKETLEYDLMPQSYVSKEISELLFSAEKTAILHTHGGILDGKWVYQDTRLFGKKYFPIQNWINKNDGKYDVLFITACGKMPESKINSKKSIVVHAKESFSLDDLARRKVNLFVYLPEEGYV